MNARELVGQRLHRDELETLDLSGCRLSWGPDNRARIAVVEEDITGFVRCCRAAGCQVAEICAHGKPHRPTRQDQGPSRCYDHKPYLVGGIMVWASPVQANKQLKGSV